jgi:ribose 5-phosphate isomerase B
MRIALASDHAGYALKEHVRGSLARAGHDVVDLGTDSPESVDYPLVTAPAAAMVSDGEADRGVLVCGSGVGVAIVANTHPNVRAVNAHDADEVTMSRRHNDANVLTLSGQRIAPDDADRIVDAFLHTPFDGGRHARRTGQIADLERQPV